MSSPWTTFRSIGFNALQVTLIWLRLRGTIDWPWWAIGAPCLLLLILVIGSVFIIGLSHPDET